MKQAENPGSADIRKSMPANFNKAVKPRAGFEAQTQSGKSAPETRAHANVVWYQTKDDVDGKRQVTINAEWVGDSNLKNAPHPLGWGLEFQLYQWNYNLSDNRKRLLCGIGIDSKFWADASLKGATLTVVFNDGTTTNKFNPYIDDNHLLDLCQQGAIGFGFQYAKGVPDMNVSRGGSSQKLHQSIFADLRLKNGKKFLESHICSHKIRLRQLHWTPCKQ